MVKEKLPMCEILSTAGGDYAKPRSDVEAEGPGSTKGAPNPPPTAANSTAEPPAEAEDDSTKELIMKKYKKAKELVTKAEHTHKRTENYAKDMRDRLLAIQKEVHAGKDQIHAMQKKEGAAKKRVVAAHATVKKAKIEVETMEQQEQTQANREVLPMSLARPVP